MQSKQQLSPATRPVSPERSDEHSATPALYSATTSLLDQIRRGFQAGRTNYVPLLQRFFMVCIGAIIAALGYSLFQLPFNLAGGGLSGVGIIVNHFTGWPVGHSIFC